MYTIHHTTLQQRRREQSLSAYINEKDEDLVLFHDMQKRERAATHESVAQPLHRGTLATIVPPQSTEEDIFTSSEWDKHDYDWLMTTPPTSFIPNVKHEPTGSGSSLSGSAIARSSTKATSRIGSLRSEPLVQIMHPSFDSQQSADPSAAFTTSTSSITRKPLSSSSSTATRTSTPARSTTVSRPIVRSSTPSKSAASSASVRSSTPTGRATTPSNRLASSTRPSTPIKRPATPTRVNNRSNTSVKTLTVIKATSLPSKSASSSRPSSPATRVRQPAAHPVAPQEPPANLQTSRVDRPHSNPRGSMALKANTTAIAKAPQPQPADAGGPRNMRLSGSPLVTRGRVSFDSLNGDKSLIRNGKLHDGVMVSVSNGVGSKMVDRIMPPRKPIPLSQKETPAVVNSQRKKPVKSTLLRDVKSTSQVKESSGFGRNLSKKSLDMALRHMDIRGTAPTGFQSFMSNIPTSSLYSVRSGNSRGISTGRGNSTSSIASSPMATSSNASSEHSMSIFIDPESSELGDETSSEMGSRASPISQPDRSMAFSTERKVNYWLGSPGCMDDTSTDIMQIFEQELVSLSTPESPLISQQEGIIDCDDFALEPI